MQMSPRCEGDFTTNPSVVAQISKRQDMCLVSLNPTTLDFRLRKLTSRQHEFSYSFCGICFKSKIFFQNCCAGGRA